MAEPLRQRLARLWRGNLAQTLRQGPLPLRLLLGSYLLFQRHNGREKAAALTFNSLLALVPFLAIMFALLKGLGVHNSLEPLILRHLTGGSQEVALWLIDYINNTNVARLGAVGLAALALTVLFLLTTIEKAFNALWQVSAPRSLLRRFADYFSVLSFGPLFLLAALSMSNSVRNQQVVQWLLQRPGLGELLVLLFEVLPFVVIALAFAFLYLFMPNTRVPLPAALLGGACAGSLWLLSQWLYVTFQFGVSRYNAIYGTMAALPVFMVWLYLSWTITLIGVALSRVWQQRQRLDRLLGSMEASVVALPVAAVRLNLLLPLYRRFAQGQPPWTREQLVRHSEQPEDAAQEALLWLERQRLIGQLETGDDGRIVPLVAARQVLLAPLLESAPPTCGDAAVQELLQRWYGHSGHLLGDLCLADLLERGGDLLPPLPAAAAVEADAQSAGNS